MNDNPAFLQFSRDDIFIVTGASSGLGAASALLLNQLGATVIAAARNKEKLNSIREKSISPEHFHIHTKDFGTELPALTTWVVNLAKQYGPLRGMFCCAGIGRIMPLRVESADIINSLFALHYTSAAMLVKAFTMSRHVRKQDGGSIVLMSSISGVAPKKAIFAYSATKSAVIAGARAWAQELGSYGYRVNSVAPGDIKTHLIGNLGGIISEDEYYQEASKSFLLPGEGVPDDVANLVAFLLSNSSRWITGQNIIIDGGQSH